MLAFVGESGKPQFVHFIPGSLCYAAFARLRCSSVRWNRQAFLIVDGLILYTIVSLLFTTYDCWYSKYEFPKLASAACGGRKKSEKQRNPAGQAFIQIVPGWYMCLT